MERHLEDRRKFVSYDDSIITPDLVPAFALLDLKNPSHGFRGCFDYFDQLDTAVALDHF
jgi:hypothetical protein